MSGHACLLAARFSARSGQTHPNYSFRQAYRAFRAGVTGACGRVASSLGVTAYHLFAVTGCTLVLGLIAAGA